MRIIIDTDTRDGVSVVNTGSIINTNTSPPSSMDGGGAPGSAEGATAAASSPGGILTLDAGQPSASLVAAIAAAGGAIGAFEPLNAGPAPAI